MLKAINLNIYVAKEIDKLSDNVAFISINEERAPLYDLKIDRLKSNVLTLQFSDLVSAVLDLNPISDSQTVELYNFIVRNKNKHFIVHCAAGVSRSAAICLFIHYVFGHELLENFWDISHPNYFVLGKLIGYHKFRQHLDLDESIWPSLSLEDKKKLRVD